jgi:hypothetical protein
MIVFGGVSDVPGVLEDLWALGWQAPVAVEDPAATTTHIALRTLAPNPSAGHTRLCFSLARDGRVELGVFDARGRRVRTLVDGPCRAGVWTAEWDGAAETGARAGAGIYFVRLVGPGVRETRKLVLVR